MKKDFEQIPHTADIKIRVYGATLEELFRNALIGMFQSVRPKAPGCVYKNDRLVCTDLTQKHNIDLRAEYAGLLLLDFLSEALYLSDVHDEAYLDVEFYHIDDHSLKATIKGVKIIGFEVVEIKAVTYHDLKIQKVDGQWQVDIVFDI